MDVTVASGGGAGAARDLVHGAVYNFVLKTLDTDGNTLRQDSAAGVTVDIITDLPQLFEAEGTDSYITQDATFILNYSLPEEALPGSVQLSLVR